MSAGKERLFERAVQIAGVIDWEDAKTVIDAGVKFIGFPLRLPVNKPDLTEDEARELIKKFPKDVFPVLITYLNKSGEILDFVNFLNVEIVQLHGAISVVELRKLKTIKKDLKIIKSLVVRGNNFEELTGLVKSAQNFVDAFITDTFNPATGASGATGKTHDWEVSKALVELSTKPVILAGGLNPANVRKAISAVKPAGVDSHTGVEADNGRKDAAKVRLFLEEALKGFEQNRA